MMEKNTQQEEQIDKKETMTDENVPLAKEGSSTDELKEAAPAKEPDPLKQLQDDLAESKDKYIRLYAEFDNHRRRTSKEKLELIQNANEQLIVTLLPIMDDFERAEKACLNKEDSGIEGFLLIKNKLEKALDQYGVKSMEFTSDTEFDPDFHEAITQVPVTDESKKGKIVDVIEKGYLLNDKVIRFAKVVIGS